MLICLVTRECLHFSTPKISQWVSQRSLLVAIWLLRALGAIHRSTNMIPSLMEMWLYLYNKRPGSIVINTAAVSSPDPCFFQLVEESQEHL